MPMTILSYLAGQAVANDAGRVKAILSSVYIQAAVKENFTDMPDGGHKCKLCGEPVPHPRAAAAHLAVHHWHALQAAMVLQARDFSENRRKALAKTGAAMPHGGFPIVNKQDLKNAERAIGRAKNPGATRAHIRKRAKALGVEVSDAFKK